MVLLFFVQNNTTTSLCRNLTRPVLNVASITAHFQQKCEDAVCISRRNPWLDLEHPGDFARIHSALETLHEWEADNGLIPRVDRPRPKVRTARRPAARYPSNLLFFGNPLGGWRPASARLPIQSLSSGFMTVNVRPAKSPQSPSSWLGWPALAVRSARAARNLLISFSVG